MIARKATPKGTPTPTPIFSAVLSPVGDGTCVAVGKDGSEEDDDDEVAVSAAVSAGTDTLETTVVGDLEADERPVVEIWTSDAEIEEVAETAMVSTSF